jgi:hypothetical protein
MITQLTCDRDNRPAIKTTLCHWVEDDGYGHQIFEHMMLCDDCIDDEDNPGYVICDCNFSGKDN